MKFYDCTTAPSPRRVRIFLAEKGINVPTVQVDLRNNEQLTPAFRAINPDATVPSLELDDGTRINDAIGIASISKRSIRSRRSWAKPPNRRRWSPPGSARWSAMAFTR